MTTAVETVGLLYDNEDLQRDDLQIVCRIRKGLMETPSVRGEDTIVPSRAGRMEGLRVNDTLAIEVVCTVQADPTLTSDFDQMASYRENCLFLRNLFRPTRSRAELSAVLENGDIKNIDARPLNAVWAEDIQSHVATVSFALEGYDDWAIESTVSS